MSKRTAKPRSYRLHVKDAAGQDIATVVRRKAIKAVALMRSLERLGYHVDVCPVW
jgi:hypothetical protein